MTLTRSPFSKLHIFVQTLHPNRNYTLIARMVAFTACMLTFTGCDKLFEFSPYQANVDESRCNTTAKNIRLLAQKEIQTNHFTFAVMADCHFYYDNLSKVVNHINQNDKIQFVLYCGDITDQALMKEYDLFYDIMGRLNKPYFVVIGNHDYNSNGELIYDQMFGKRNFSIEYANSKFVIFDDIVWESNTTPDFDWLQQELSSEKLFDHIFVATHMPPSSDQFTSVMENRYRSLMANNQVSISIHGHEHRFSLDNHYGDGVMYLVVPSLKTPEYCTLTCADSVIEVQTVNTNQAP